MGSPAEANERSVFKILTLNNISVVGLERLPRDKYEVASEIQHPDAILVRSFDMHDMAIPETLKAVGRAGAGVNNIPLDNLTERGIPVFNTPGANSSAVKELTLAGLLLAARKICEAWDFARNMEGNDEDIRRQVEEGKGQFVGFELPGRTLGVIGLGAVGVKVANAALSLGMRVLGYDPEITVKRAWQLSSDVKQAVSIDDLLANSDFVSIHIPLVKTTHHMINDERLRSMRRSATLLNFSRQEIVDQRAVAKAIGSEHLHAYVCDFPSNLLKGCRGVITLPHIGASTREAEENCAAMVANQLRNFLEDGNIRNSVNFPEVVMPRNEGYRIAVVNANVPNMLGQISTTLAKANLNIVDMLNKSRGEIAYTLTDVERSVTPLVIEQIAKIDGVMAVRAI